jgi:hypothetical protein
VSRNTSPTTCIFFDLPLGEQMLRGERAPDGRDKNNVHARQTGEDAQLRRICSPICNLQLVINQRAEMMLKEEVALHMRLLEMNAW